MKFSIKTLDRDAVDQHLHDLIAIGDGFTSWTADHFQAERPGKWKHSRLAVNTAGKPIAYMVVSRRDSRTLHVNQIVVSADARGAGIGAALFQNLYTQKADRVTLKLASDNAGACRFYEREGFRVITRVGDLLWMQKHL